MATLVVYGSRDEDGEAHASMLTMESHKNAIALHLNMFPDHVVLDKFEALSWAQAMTYYQAKYFGGLYEPEPDDWKPFVRVPYNPEQRVEKVVRLLNENGFKTTDSGDGHTNVNAGMEMALPFPHVMIVVTDPSTLSVEADRLVQLLKDQGVDFQLPVMGESMTETVETSKRLPSVEAIYSPLDGYAIITLLNVVDSDLEDS